MPLFNKPLDTISEDDLQALITAGEAEDKRIEYKQTIPAQSSEKKSLLEGVSSFANAVGGDMVLGMRAEDGVPVEVCGLPGISEDQEKLRLEEIIRNGIRPRVRFDIQPVRLKDPTKHLALIIRVGRGIEPPHQIVFDKDFRFYSRNSAGKFRLDVDEIRSIIELTGTIAQRIRAFRADRLASIMADQTPVPLEAQAKLVLHLIPLGAMDRSHSFEVSTFENDRRLRPIGTPVTHYRYNLDGILSYTTGWREGTPNKGYAQLYRNGIIECVAADLLESRDAEGRPYIKSIPYEHYLIESLPEYLSIQQQLELEHPIFVMLSLLGVREYYLKLSSQFDFFMGLDTHHIDRDALVIPEVQLDSFAYDPPTLLRPIFDAVWNAAGYRRCLNYTEDGKWRHG